MRTYPGDWTILQQNVTKPQLSQARGQDEKEQPRRRVARLRWDSSGRWVDLRRKTNKKKQQKTANWCGKHYSGRGTSHSREDGARGSIPHVPGITGACREGPAAARASVPPPNARPPRTPHPSRPASSAKGRRAQTRSWLDGNKRTSGLRLLGVRLRVETDPLRAALPKQCREQLNRFY